MNPNANIITIVLILLILGVSYRMYHNSDFFQLTCIVSDVDGEKYCVREQSKVHLAADKLANVNKGLQAIVDHCTISFPDQENVQRIKKGYNPKKIMEILPTSEFTAYSENKGEKLAFCLNTQKGGSKMIDANTLMYVAIHELAHIATKEIGHTPTFWQNFKFLLIQAKAINVYNPVDYKNNPEEYCGMTIKDNPYYDV